MAPEPCSAIEPLHSAWLDGQLPGHDRDRVGRHLQGCAPCRAAVDGLDRTRTLLAATPVRALPPTLQAVLRSSLQDPAGVPDPLGDPPPRAHAERLVGAGASPSHTAGRFATFAIGLAGVLSAAFALGGQPPADVREVDVPMELFVADHLVRTVGGPVSTPVLVER